jgi:hypothetical protein
MANITSDSSLIVHSFNRRDICDMLLMEAEHRRMANVPLGLAANAPQLSLAEFITRKLNEIGPTSKDEALL